MAAKAPVPSKEVLYELYVDKLWSTSQLGERFDVASTTASKWLKDYGIPVRPRTGAARYVIRTIKGTEHKLCRGPLHRAGKFVPTSKFGKTPRGKYRSHCSPCETFSAGRETYVDREQYLKWLESCVRRIGVMETARRLDISYRQLLNWRTDPPKYMQRKSARKIVDLMNELRQSGEVRHRLSIKHGSSARGRKERTVTTTSDLLVPTSDLHTEQRRNNRHRNMERERQYTRDRRAKQKQQREEAA